MPVRTKEQAEIVINKIILYDTADANAEWTKKVLIASDSSFPEVNEHLRRNIGTEYTTRTFKFAPDNAEKMHSEILSELNQGQLVMNYFGHGSVGVWQIPKSREMLNETEAGSLTNGDRLPFVVAMTCLNGFFHDVYSQSLAETILAAPNGGAIAMLGSSSMESSAKQTALNNKIFAELFTKQHQALGDAVLEAKNTAGAKQRRTWIYFGDPSTKLKGLHTNMGTGNKIDEPNTEEPKGCSGCNVGMSQDGIYILGLMILFVFLRTRRSIAVVKSILFYE